MRPLNSGEQHRSLTLATSVNSRVSNDAAICSVQHLTLSFGATFTYNRLRGTVFGFVAPWEAPACTFFYSTVVVEFRVVRRAEPQSAPNHTRRVVVVVAPRRRQPMSRLAGALEYKPFSFKISAFPLRKRSGNTFQGLPEVRRIFPTMRCGADSFDDPIEVLSESIGR